MASVVFSLVCMSVACADEDSVSQLTQRAEAGDAPAQFELGRAYYRGNGVAKDAEKAALWIRRAAEAGYRDAIEGLGFLYTTGNGVAQDEEEAVKWFRLAAEAGSARAKLNVGLLLRQGKTIPLSNEESLRFMQEAAEGGSLEARSYLAQLYFLGDRLQRPDYAKAKPHAAKAAEAGDPAAQNIMGLLTRDGVGPAAKGKDPSAAESWFLKAAEQNEVKAQANLAHLMGVASPASTNRVEALKWLLLAKDKNEPTATKTYHEISPTLPPSLEKEASSRAAAFLLRRSAESGR